MERRVCSATMAELLVIRLDMVMSLQSYGWWGHTGLAPVWQRGIMPLDKRRTSGDRICSRASSQPAISAALNDKACVKLASCRGVGNFLERAYQAADEQVPAIDQHEEQ